MLGLFYNYATHLIFVRYVNRAQQILFLKYTCGRTMLTLVLKKKKSNFNKDLTCRSTIQPVDYIVGKTSMKSDQQNVSNVITSKFLKLSCYKC